MPVLEQVAPAFEPNANGRRRFTVNEAAKLAELFAGERYELIDGDIISKMGQNPPHAHVVRTLTALLTKLLGERIQAQLPVRLPAPDGVYSEPDPDIALLVGNISEFIDRHPTANDVALLIEVSDTTLQIDRGSKYRLYARARIPEYWIVDLPNSRTIVCRQPSSDEYKSVTIFDANEDVSSASAPGFIFKLDSLFPTADT